jgi:ACS family glucarate transporter-like MFS transporter
VRSTSYRLVLLVTCANLLGYMDRVCISVLAPKLRSELGFSAGDIGLIFGAFGLSYALFQMPWGMIVDRRGARNIIAGVILAWSMFTGLTAVTRGLMAFVSIRFLFGVSEAALAPAVASLFRRTVPVRSRPTAFGSFLSGGRIGGIVAPGFAAFLAIRYGWRSVFVLFAVLGVFAAAIWLLAFPRETVVEESQDVPLRLPVARLSVSLTAVILVGFIYTMTWQFFVTWFPSYLIENRGFSFQKAGTYTGLPFLFGLLATFAGGPLSEWITGRFGMQLGRRLLVMTGLLGSGLLFYLGPSTPRAMLGTILIALAAGSGDLILSTLWATAVDIGGRSAGSVAGLMNSVASLGGFLSPVLISKLLQHGASWNYVLKTWALLNVTAALIWLFVRPPSMSCNAPPVTAMATR